MSNIQEISIFLRNLYTVAEIKIMIIGSCVGACFAAVVGGVDKGIQALLVLVAIDYLTGMMAGYKTGVLSSSRGFKGVIKKLVIFLVVGFANLLDCGMGLNMLKSMAVFAYSANEGLSIIENIDRMGYSEYIPFFLRDKVESLRKERGVQ